MATVACSITALRICARSPPVERSITASAPAAVAIFSFSSSTVKSLLSLDVPILALTLVRKPLPIASGLMARMVHITANHDGSIYHALPDKFRLNTFLYRADFHFFRNDPFAGFFQLCHFFLQNLNTIFPKYSPAHDLFPETVNCPIACVTIIFACSTACNNIFALSQTAASAEAYVQPVPCVFFVSIQSAENS